MLSKLAGWIVGEEPVATATGLAALVSAALGVAAAFGVGITPEQIAAVAALAAALAGYLSRRAVTPVITPKGPREAGGVPLAALLLVVVVVLVLGGIASSCDALFEDEDEVNDLGITVTEQAYREGDYCTTGHERSRCGGGYSGGPSGGYYEGGQGGEDYDGDGDGNRCRNFCFYGVPYPGQPGTYGR